MCIIRYGALLGVYHDRDLTRYLESMGIVQFSWYLDNSGRLFGGLQSQILESRSLQ